ncbi:MAG TPA: hypothetical protein VMV46_04760 [Thermoanaerobaculia bacterium]|nr:hypothetical protein [Thermoanaerobaculia bacterium]
MSRPTIRFRDNARATVATLSVAMAFAAAWLAPAGRATADDATPVVEVTNLGLALPNSLLGFDRTLVILDGGLTALLVSDADVGFDLGVLHLYDPATGILTNLGIVGSELLALDDNRLAINVVEFFEGVDLNGDGDLSDRVVHVYDPVTGTITNLGLVPSSSTPLGVALDGGGLAINVIESGQGADLNGDGDLADTVVHVHDPATGTTTNLGIVNSQPILRGLHGGAIGLTLSEVTHGIDFNGDGDTEDRRVAHIHEPATGITTNLGLAIVGLPTAVGNDSVALFVSELGQGEDLNGDGDIGGLGEFGPIDTVVLHLHDQVTGITTNLGVEGVGLTWLSGGVPRLPGGAFIFLVSELVTGVDLNGDGDTLDGVVHVHDPTTGATTNLGLDFFTDEESPGYAVLDDGRFAFTVREFRQGADLNGDGDIEDTVAHVYDPATGTTVSTGLASNAEGLVGLGGDVVAFAVIEMFEGADLNGDGDTFDPVVHLMDLSTGELVNTGIAGFDLLELTDGTLAITASEFSSGEDLNGDGDTNDIVTVVYNPTTGQTANVGIAGSPWRNLDLEAGVPPTTDPWPGDEFLLMAWEPMQGVDLNGDGDTTDRYALHLVAIDWGIDSDDAPPLVSSVSVTPNPAPIGTPIELTATFDDSETGGSVIASAAYSIDSDAAVLMEAVDGSFDEVTEDVFATLPAFTTAGVREVCVAGTDAAGNVSAPECIALAVYDPAAGFVTGGGWIDSPAGAYNADPDAAGKASFGFVSRYHDGASTPDGQTQFRLREAGLTFHSEVYDTLVVSGAEARYGGSGRVNGNSGYGFRVTVVDGDLAGDGIDRLRLVIWQTASGTVVYDSQPGDADTSPATTPLGGGSITIHTQ